VVSHADEIPAVAVHLAGAGQESFHRIVQPVLRESPVFATAVAACRTTSA
jgi:hypothetical protein